MNIDRIATVVLLAFFALVAGGFVLWAYAAQPRDLNQLVDQTNFLVNRGCAGTLISVDERLIVTNHHCIRNKIKIVEREVRQDGRIKKVDFEQRDRVTVQQRDYRRHELVGSISYVTEIEHYDKATDLALLRLVGDNLRSDRASPILPADMEVERGEPVVVVGNPFGLDATMTAGIVSSTTRSFRTKHSDEEIPFIQVDAPVNPGNSGGAVYSMEGFVIGIPAVTCLGCDGLSLAIHAEIIRDFLDDACLEIVHNPKGQTHDECMAEKEDEDEEDEE